MKPALKGIENFMESLRLFEIFNIRLKCFSIIPCNVTTTNKDNRIGSCVDNDFKVIEFKHHDDYIQFMNELSLNELKNTKNILNFRLEKFIPFKNKKMKYLKQCLNETFTTFRLKYVENFSHNFLTKKII